MEDIIEDELARNLNKNYDEFTTNGKDLGLLIEADRLFGKEGHADNLQYVPMKSEVDGSSLTSSATTDLDLSHLKTQNVKYMNSMFYKMKANKLDVSKFNIMIGGCFFITSNVTDMRGMFLDSRIPELDLSSFDTSKATLGNILQGTTAEKGYARTQMDADKLNASSSKAKVNFEVKK